MKANEFVKKFGITKAVEIVNYRNNNAEECHSYIFIGGNGAYSTSSSYTSSGLNVNVDELEQLIESHEYIEKFGGMDKAKRLRGLACFLTVSDCKKYNQAIVDVESCL